MKYTAIILSGGFSKRFGNDKGLTKLLGKPMILHVYEKIVSLVNEVIIIVSSEAQLREYKNSMDDLKFIVDESDFRSPIIGALTGFKNAKGEYSILLSCDTPLLSPEIASLLLELAPDHDAVIPRWPNNYIEPLQAVYNTKSAYKSASKAIEQGNFRLFDMIMGLRKILYISTLALNEVDSCLNTFLNVNTQSDLARVEKILKSQI